MFCSARRRCRRSRAHSRARTCAAARRASPCGSVPARAAASHDSIDCPRSPLVPAPDRLHTADVETDLPTATARRLAIPADVGNVRVEAALSSMLSPLLLPPRAVHTTHGMAHDDACALAASVRTTAGARDGDAACVCCPVGAVQPARCSLRRLLRRPAVDSSALLLISFRSRVYEPISTRTRFLPRVVSMVERENYPRW